MKYNRDWIQDHIVERLPSDQEIVDILNAKSSEVEGMEKHKDSSIFDVKVLPDRAHYMLSHRGMAYDLCACLGLNMKSDSGSSNSDISTDKISVKIDEVRYCKRYSATYITNIQNTSSPQWLKSRLESIGQRSINLIVDLTNYVMFDTGQPLHAFDAKKIKGGIVIRRANVGEKLETLDGKDISLRREHVIIADEIGPLALAGIKGGKRAEVDLNTDEIILESANFNPVSVRKTSFDVQIRNESSKRFENEITPYLIDLGRNVFIELIKRELENVNIQGTKIVGDNIGEKNVIKLSSKKVKSILGTKIDSDFISNTLKSFNCVVEKSGQNYIVQIPYERLDLQIEEDLIDEIGRIYGLENIESKLPEPVGKLSHSDQYSILDFISNILPQSGFSEIITRSFTSNGEIETVHPVASDKSFLRKDLSTNLEKSLEQNILNSPLLGLDTIKIYELGKVFTKAGEFLNLAFGIAMTKKSKGAEQMLMDMINDILSQLRAKLIFKEPKIKKMQNKIVCEISDISLDLNRALEDQPLGSTSRTNLEDQPRTFKPYSNEPFIVRDIAIFVPVSVSKNSIKEEIEKSLSSDARKLLIKGPDLFDTFTKEDKVSYAFRLIFQAFDRTLSDEEANHFMQAVYDSVQEQGWTVR